MTILLLALIRLAVRLINPPPPYPDELAKWERAFAVWTHRSFYFLLIALPLTGLAAVSKGGPSTELVGGLEVPTIPMPGDSARRMKCSSTPPWPCSCFTSPAR